jgi:tRNA A37 methylthiotransferase MiaB
VVDGSSVPKVCTFRGIREEVMQRVWEKARKLEERGVPLMPNVFGLLIKEEWKKISEEVARVCPVVSPEDLRRMIEEIEREEKSSPASVKAEEARKPLEALIGVSVRTQEKKE